MTDKRRGLGRGLGALIPSSVAGSDSAAESSQGPPARPVDLFFPEAKTVSPVKALVSREMTATDGLVQVPGAQFAELQVGDIHPNRKQPRTVFDEDEMAELVHSVREVGILQPIIVRKSAEPNGEPYELVMGERRWRASQKAGLATIPVIIRDTTDLNLLRDALLENLHRSQLNPLEEAAAYQQLLEDFGTTHEELADRIGRSRPQVTNTLRLLKLPALVQRRVAAGVLSAGHARALLSLPDSAAMERLAQRIVAEGMSVRATEEAVSMYQSPDASRKGPSKPNARHERLDYLAGALSDRLDTNVKITLGARKGKVSIDFASVEDLNRIMDVLGSSSNV
ncbi:ParB/RepB/Spo0J family partition protein [Paenarthrobacter sp. Z7-10]|uniref:ParB/RepB/Spo0J family partition protein n=1 Tax=Paenarthrobacter sp. Z7-10 TaxID=2787635 RepID=UPI0022A9A0D1|nr:ParB/RepB/Spo0J family partition protein [Paenarthrobacter sp. Z7-10]MCZ2401723.1 ParB/RepB/Spo0J family partition protein [Paenarthrobacter sp. Z7-10]